MSTPAPVAPIAEWAQCRAPSGSVPIEHHSDAELGGGVFRLGGARPESPQGAFQRRVRVGCPGLVCSGQGVILGLSPRVDGFDGARPVGSGALVGDCLTSDCY